MVYEVGDSFDVSGVDGDKAGVLKITRADNGDGKAVDGKSGERESAQRPPSFPWLWYGPVYLCCSLLDVWPLGDLVHFVQLVVAARRKRIWAWYGVLLGLLTIGPAMHFGMGVVDYWQNDGRLRRTESIGGGLHREYRCDWAPTTCVLDGLEGFRHGPYNLALKTMIKIFGPMAGSFTGAYPSLDEAWEALKQSKTQLRYRVPGQFYGEQGQLLLQRKIPARLKELFAKDIHEIHGNFEFYSRSYERDWKNWRPYAVFGETLIVACGPFAVLINRGTGRAYAYYYFRDYSEELIQIITATK
jgi:hypothetical protein